MTSREPSEGESADARPRARQAGIAPGVLPPGPLNAITDVCGVLVGHVTMIEGDGVRTGATAILPHGGNLYQEKVPAGIAVANGFGKLMGYTQVRELGEIETPILLTNTLAVPRAADAVLDWTLSRPGNEEVRSVNPVVGETNDGFLNDIRRRVLTAVQIGEAIAGAAGGPVDEGTVGAGTGTVTFGWKGGIGTSSRRLPSRLGGHTIGALVQSNYGGILQILGVPVGRELGRGPTNHGAAGDAADGSIMIVVATDAPLSDRNLARLARRAFAGLARTGAFMSNGSGDYAIAFSTAESVRRTAARRREASVIEDLPNDEVSPLFLAVIEATEEAIYNSLFRATTLTGFRGVTVEALPVDRVLTVMRECGRLQSGGSGDR
ncbi:MAG: P1 family peptidase [Anaerolineae bacterium]|nr:P1 family peptidase [Anaerolineae bacterium]